MGYLSCKAESSVQVSTSASHRGGGGGGGGDRPRSGKIQQFEYSELEAATSNFSEERLLGRGSHGLVYKAVLRSGHLVAVKKPSRRRQSTSACDEFDNEIQILSNLWSSRLVNLVGYSYSRGDGRLLLVVEFMANGTLYDALHKGKGAAAANKSQAQAQAQTPSWARRIRLALQTAKAIETLHSQSPPVIHRDIKSANVLIDGNHNARLGDFGLALRCHADDYRLCSTPPAGTMGYLDPCYVTPDNLSTKTDVFSFGILLLEIISGRKAIDVGHSPPSILDWAIPLIRRGRLLAIYDPRIPPPRDPMFRKQLAVIAAKCVRCNRERRPSIKEVAAALEGLTKLEPLHSWNGFVNPCLMVENVGHPVAFADALLSSRQLPGLECGSLGDVDEHDARPLKNSRRVYSDLGFRNNLMDLMGAELDDGGGGEGGGGIIKRKQNAPHRGSSFRIITQGRYVVPKGRTTHENRGLV